MQKASSKIKSKHAFGSQVQMGGRLVDAIEKQPAQVKIGPVNLHYNGAFFRKKSAFSLNVKSDDLPG